MPSRPARDGVRAEGCATPIGCLGCLATAWAIPTLLLFVGSLFDDTSWHDRLTTPPLVGLILVGSTLVAVCIVGLPHLVRHQLARRRVRRRLSTRAGAHDRPVASDAVELGEVLARDARVYLADFFSVPESWVRLDDEWTMFEPAAFFPDLREQLVSHLLHQHPHEGVFPPNWSELQTLREVAAACERQLRDASTETP